MRSRWPIPAVALAVLFCSSRLGFAYSAQLRASEREQKILRIQRLIQEHDLEKAHLELAEAAKEFPTDEGFDNLLGIVEAQQGAFIAAEKSFRRAIAKAPRFTVAYLNLGRLYQENIAADPQARRKALDVYRRVLDYDAVNAEANYQSAALFLQQGQYQVSLDRVSRLSAEQRNSAQTLSIQCADYAGLGNRKGAEEAAARLMAAPDFSEPDAQQALLGLLPGKRDDLIVSLLESLQSHEQLGPALLQALGSAYERKSRLAEARAWGRIWSIGHVEEVSSVQRAVAQVFECRPMQLVRSGCGYSRDLAPGTFPVLRTIAVPEDVKFPYRFDPKQLAADSVRRNVLTGGVVAHIVHSINSPSVVFRSLAGD